MRKRGTAKNSTTSLEMASKSRNSDDSRRATEKNRDMIDGSLAISAQPFNTVTTVSAPSGFRLAQHMTIAGSFLDFALFVADVEHLKFILDAGKDRISYYTMLVVLLIASLTLQLIVVFLLFIVGFKKPQKTTVTTRNAQNIPMEGPSQSRSIDADGNQNTVIDEIANSHESTILNHIIICLVTLIAIINVFVTVFGDRSATSIIEKFKSDEAARIANHTQF